MAARRAAARPTGEPYALGDFLFLVDPAAPRLARALHRRPRSAATARSGSTASTSTSTATRSARSAPTARAVDVAASFVTLIDAVRAALPEAQLVFNNVNDFPTWRHRPRPRRTPSTSRSGRRTRRSAHLADVVTRARARRRRTSRSSSPRTSTSTTARRRRRPTSPPRSPWPRCSRTARPSCSPARRTASSSTRTTSATTSSSASTARRCSSAGTTSRRARRAAASTRHRRRHRSLRRRLQRRLRRRATRRRRHRDRPPPAGSGGASLGPTTGYVVHLINLVGQDDTEWDARRETDPARPGRGTLRVRRVGAACRASGSPTRTGGADLRLSAECRRRLRAVTLPPCDVADRPHRPSAPGRPEL